MTISPDSVAYLATARDIAYGHGATAPYDVNPPPQPVPSSSAPAIPRYQATTIFEPLYSFVLAPLVWTFGPQTGSRVLGALGLAVLLLLAGWLPFLWSKKRSALWLGPLLVLTAPDLLSAYSNVESEALFLPLVLSAAFLMRRYLERPTLARLAPAAALFAAAALTRYAGLGLLFGGALVVLSQRNREWRARTADAAIFAGVSIGPVILWLVRDSIQGQGANRSIHFHPPTRADLHSALHGLGAWVSPASAPGLVKAVIVIVVATAVLTMAWRSRKRTATVQLVLVLLVLGYLAGVIVSDTFFDASTGIDARILAPAHVLVIVGVAYLVVDLLAELTMRWRLLPAVALGALAVLGSAQAGNWWRNNRRASVGYAGPAWEHSAFLADVRSLPGDVPIFTNAGDAVWYVDGRGTYSLPQLFNPQSGQPNRQLGPELAALATFIVRRHADVAFFSKVTWRAYLPSEAMLAARLPVHVIVATSDGVILGPASRG